MIQSLEATITAVSFLSLNLTLKLCVFHRVSKLRLEADAHLDSQFDTGETGASERTRALHEKNFL